MAFNRQCNLNGFTPNSTGRIQPVEFQIRPGMKYWSNWVEIHWDYLYACPYIVWLNGLVEFGGLNLNGFTPNLTGRI